MSVFARLCSLSKGRRTLQHSLTPHEQNHASRASAPSSRGLFFIIIVSTLVDIVLHAAKVLSIDRRADDRRGWRRWRALTGSSLASSAPGSRPASRPTDRCDTPLSWVGSAIVLGLVGRGGKLGTWALGPRWVSPSRSWWWRYRSAGWAAGFMHGNKSQKVERSRGRVFSPP